MDNHIRQAANRYRAAIDSAHKDGSFSNDNEFFNFPDNCCGTTCTLLAEFLRCELRINTIWVSNIIGNDTHAWLVVKDYRVFADNREIEIPEDIRNVLNKYSNGQYDRTLFRKWYDEQDIEDGLIIDITGDQFCSYNKKVFVGRKDDFHSQFKFLKAWDYEGILSEREEKLYSIIKEYL